MCSKLKIIAFQQPEQQWATYYDEAPFEDELEDEFESEEDLDDETYNRKGSKRKKTFVGRKPKVCACYTGSKFEYLIRDCCESGSGIDVCFTVNVEIVIGCRCWK